MKIAYLLPQVIAAIAVTVIEAVVVLLTVIVCALGEIAKFIAYWTPPWDDHDEPDLPTL